MKQAIAIGALLLTLGGVPALAQPADLPIPAATTSEYPPGVSVRRTAKGPVYADSRGRTLYGMDMRTLVRWSPDASKYCKDACAEQWEPMLAPAGSRPNIMFPRGFGGPPPAAPGGQQPRPQANRAPGQAALPEGFVLPQRAPDWTIIEGPAGPQWVYKGWHMVYTRKGDRPGSTVHDGADGKTWNTLKFVPPVPKLAAPATVTTSFDGDAYVLTDKDGRVLFTGQCRQSCETWVPLAGPMAGRGIGEWSVNLAGDKPQWAWRGQPVFVSHEEDPTKPPAAGKILRP